MDPLVFCLCLTCVVLYLIRWLLRPSSGLHRGLPPGPRGLPFLGYFPFLGPRPYRTLDALKRKYGGVFGMYLGNTYCVVLADLQALKVAYNRDEFHGRPPNSPFKLSESTSLIELGGQDWTDQRRFSLMVLRNLGFGKTRIEDVIQDEIDLLFEELDRGGDGSGPALFHRLFSMATTNIIGVLLYGQHLSYADPRRRHLDSYLAQISQFHSQLSLHAFFPWARRLVMGLSLFRYGLARTCIAELEDLNRLEIREHEATMDPENVRDYIDSFLLESQKRGPQAGPFNKGTLNGNLSLFLRAGSMTTRATVEWALLAAALHPEVQDRVRREIQKVAGGRRPCWADRDNMPYTSAVLLEAQRWRTVVPINILRYTTRDTEVKGYRVPAGTVVISNLWSIHNDPVHWPDPQDFCPERMLTADGQSLAKLSDAFVSFSTGRRACPGQALANMEMFLFFSSILQRYSVTLPQGHKPNLEGVVHVTWQPKNLLLDLTPILSC